MQFLKTVIAKCNLTPLCSKNSYKKSTTNGLPGDQAREVLEIARIQFSLAKKAITFSMCINKIMFPLDSISWTLVGNSSRTDKIRGLRFCMYFRTFDGRIMGCIFLYPLLEVDHYQLLGI